MGGCGLIGLVGLIGLAIGVVVVAGAVALFLLVLAAEFWRILLRRPELRLGVDRIELRGPGIDAELAWGDVGVVDYRDLGTRWAAGIAIRVGQVPDAPGLLTVLRALHAAGRDGRAAMIARGHPEASGH